MNKAMMKTVLTGVLTTLIAMYVVNNVEPVKNFVSGS